MKKRIGRMEDGDSTLNSHLEGEMAIKEISPEEAYDILREDAGCVYLRKGRAYSGT